jgi:hypothetical protein
MLTLADTSSAAVQLYQTDHSCMAQHFGWLKRRTADKAGLHWLGWKLALRLSAKISLGL